MNTEWIHTLLLCLACSRDAENWKQRHGTPAALATSTYLKNNKQAPPTGFTLVHLRLKYTSMSCYSEADQSAQKYNSSEIIVWT